MMRTFRHHQVQVLPIVLGLILPCHLSAQTVTHTEAVRVVEVDDEFTPGVYAYVRSEAGPVDRIDGDQIRFSYRAPSLVFACTSRGIRVAYYFDSALYYEDGTISVRHRFDGVSPAPAGGWPVVIDRFQEDVETFVSLAQPDSAALANNSVLQALEATAMGVSLPESLTDDFIEGALVSGEVTLRAVDPLDGETFTDTFPLAGLSEALDVLQGYCGE